MRRVAVALRTTERQIKLARRPAGRRERAEAKRRVDRSCACVRMGRASTGRTHMHLRYPVRPYRIHLGRMRIPARESPCTAQALT
eukprot:104001-Rhodomonas_salina.3